MSTAGRFKWLAAVTLAVVMMTAGAWAQQASPYFTGDGGKGIRLAVLEPAGKGLSTDDQWMLSLVQGSITGDFNKFSRMTIIDRQNLEKVMGEWKEATSGKYSDADYVKIGNLTNASHILTGNISKTANAIMIEFSVTDLQSGERKASYSPKPVSALALENLSAVKEAAADLLTQLGVKLTSAALAELKRTENIAKIQAETMLARGITAQRQGTEVAALSYFFQAAILDPSLVEAVNRSSVMAANISSGNIGADARNDIAWRKAWVERLTEAEKYIDNLNRTVSMPYTLYYSDEIIQGDINYKDETMSLTIKTYLYGGKGIEAWALSVERALQAVYDGLNATKRKVAWGLDEWPSQGVTNLNPFTEQGRIFTIVVELVNSRNKVIGKQEFKTGGYWKYTTWGRPGVSTSTDGHEDVRFTNVKADEITDNLTIRFASVNGEAAETAARKGVLQIKAMSKGEFDDLYLPKTLTVTGLTVTGGRSRASIQRVVMQNIGALHYAYNRRVRDKPDLAGKVTVKFAIDEFGKVISAQVVESTINDSELENTVVKEMKVGRRRWGEAEQLETTVVTTLKHMVFEKIDKPSDVTEVTITYSIAFSPVGPSAAPSGPSRR